MNVVSKFPRGVSECWPEAYQLEDTACFSSPSRKRLSATSLTVHIGWLSSTVHLKLVFLHCAVHVPATHFLHEPGPGLQPSLVSVKQACKAGRRMNP